MAYALCGLSALPSLALAPFPQPEPFAGVDPGSAAAYADRWSVTLPTREPDEPDTTLAMCTLPVRIEAADSRHIFYLGPRDSAPDAAIELVERDGGAVWTPIAGGPSFFAVWISADIFFLYDAVPETDADWGLPYIYRRCDPQG